MVSAVDTVWVVLVLAKSQQSVQIPWAPHWGQISVVGFTSLSLEDGLNTGPTVLLMEIAETVGVVLAGRFICKEYVWGTPEINCRKVKDTDKNLGKERTPQ